MAAPWDGLLESLERLRASRTRQQPGGSGVETEENHIAEYLDALKGIPEYEVLIGIPSDEDQPHSGPAPIGETERKDGKINNAALGFIHEKGSPLQNIPARPFLYPGVKDSRNQWEPRLSKAAQAALAGNRAAMIAALGEAGMLATRAVRNRIRAGIPPPLKPATVRARRRRSAGSKYRRKALTAADVTPLIDTGQLLRSITYVIKRRGKVVS